MKKGWLVLIGVVLMGLVVFGVMSNRQMRTHLRSEYYRIVVGDQQVTLDEYNRVTIGMDMGHVLAIINEGRLAGPVTRKARVVPTTRGLTLSEKMVSFLSAPIWWHWENEDGSRFSVLLKHDKVTKKEQEGLK